MNLRHTAIKTTCKRLLLDFGAKPVRLSITPHSLVSINEGYIDVIRETVGLKSFAIQFKREGFDVIVKFHFSTSTDIQSGTEPGSAVLGALTYGFQLSTTGSEIPDEWLRQLVDEIIEVARTKA